MDGELGQYHSLDGKRTVTEGITETVSKAVNEDIQDLPSLYEVVDPEALESLFETANGDIRVTFIYAGCRVVVNGNGRIAVAQTADERGSPFGECSNCGTELEPDIEYPVMMRQVEDKAALFAFCNEECKAEWETKQRPIADD